MKKLQGKHIKTSKGYNSYEIYDADLSHVHKIAAIVTERFRFIHGTPVIGLEQVFLEFVKDGVNITIGWDIWSGCFVMAHDSVGDKYIEVIGNYLDAHLTLF
ncbi:hypothetical protein [Paenibacillus qinlingensis]|uniref:hypothetical protein n=1 Tax=Paenibacillus qinlingensis TaxID=1837343 RepID=UPI001565B73D|nr:hypothetical protein [Paenibacillus qinlingensis]NQX57944.1 hypothetical protein [Paenibacillus qinlingensis]